ncbi:hypothetical protein ANN_26824 [Periplaneta americana]|uniref:Uncharacterized protein n=1 Tax=Periplaneta americana TaxID=6978 RepID=A0ABQ8RZG6_PERAM|nr:hypothetical protein ANN_26824 [Periplaneta americana]
MAGLCESDSEHLRSLKAISESNTIELLSSPPPEVPTLSPSEKETKLHVPLVMKTTRIYGHSCTKHKPSSLKEEKQGRKGTALLLVPFLAA